MQIFKNLAAPLPPLSSPLPSATESGTLNLRQGGILFCYILRAILNNLLLEMKACGN